MIRLLQSNWTASLLGLAVYLLTTLVLFRPIAHPPANLVKEIPARKTPGPSWTFHNPEADLLISELKQEKEALAAKEKELKDLALRLQTERAELGQITQAVHQLQADFDQNITRVREGETVNLKKLAKTYAAMTPDGAAAILRALDDDSAVKILMFMKESETAPILEALAKPGELQAKRVAAISERLRLSINTPRKASGS
jgi:flagellar motility protein MotE (MotC chaperone)